MQAQDASTFRIGKRDGSFFPFPLVLSLVLQEISRDEKRQQSYSGKDGPTPIRIDVVNETDEPAHETARKSDAMRSLFATLNTSHLDACCCGVCR